jgi:hypothetical protein
MNGEKEAASSDRFALLLLINRLATIVIYCFLSIIEIPCF